MTTQQSLGLSLCYSNIVIVITIFRKFYLYGLDMFLCFWKIEAKLNTFVVSQVISI